jgi:glycosyltransferase involved in cell wall biosynthesis
MRILIATTQVPFVRGGAETHSRGLCSALKHAGHEAEIVSIPFKWYPPERILEHLVACRLLDISESCGNPVDLVIGLKFPAYHIPHPQKKIWILHQYRTAFDLWDAQDGDLIEFPNGREIREAIDGFERKLLPEAQAIFANSANVAMRLKKFSGLQAESLYHPPPNAGKFYSRVEDDYFYFPSRLSKLKRQHLVVEALATTQNPVRVVFSGGTEHPEYEKQLRKRAARLKISDRIEWAGHVSENRTLQLYAHCRAVLFPPLDEDYGYITLEAMLSGKPVITCDDSGGPLEFVLPGQTGWMAAADPESLGRVMDEAWQDRTARLTFGKNSKERIDELGITWDNVVKKLLA